MRQQACPSCGAKASSGLPRCPSCGAALDLEVETVAAAYDDGADIELGRSPSRWWAAAAVVGVIAILGAGAIAAGGRATRAIDTTTTTSSTSTTVPRTTTSRVPRTTTTTIAEVRRTVLPGAPFLDVASPPGVVLYGMSQDQQTLWRVDLLTGEATARPLTGIRGLGTDPGYGEPVGLVPRTGGVVVASGSVPAVFVPDDVDAPFVALDTFAYPIAHADPGRLWRIDDAGRDGVRARVIDTTGAVLSDTVAIPAGYPVADDGTGRLLLLVANNLFALSTDGTTSRVTTGTPVAIRGDRIVTVECADTELRCDLVSRLRADGSEAGRAPAPVRLLDSGVSGVLSPSGSTLALYDFESGGLALVHFDGRETTHVPLDPVGWGWGWGFNQPPAWWLEEELLCGVDTAQRIRCSRDGEMQPSVSITDLSPGGFSSVVIARR